MCVGVAPPTCASVCGRISRAAVIWSKGRCGLETLLDNGRFSVLELVSTYDEGTMFLYSFLRGVLSNVLIFARETGGKGQLGMHLICNSHTKNEASHLFL